MTDPLHKTLADAVDFLRARQIPFAVIGGIAVAARGEPRLTADVDAVVGISLDRAVELVGEFEGTFFRPLLSNAQDVVQTAFLLPLRHVETTIKVDLAIGLSGYERSVISRATPVQLAGREVPIATPEDLVLMKLLASRPRDMDDARAVVARRRDSLDWEYLRRVGRELQESLAVNLLTPLAQLRRTGTVSAADEPDGGLA